ncbi:MAG: TetR/AcrR family transcriptional regulator [Anaerolineae bacterium]
MTTRTPKAERTRKLIITTAFDLFASRGYEATTMRDIAQEAGLSLGLAYRYFESKESLLLVLYEQMSIETAEAIAALPPATIAERFTNLMSARLEAAAPHRDLFGVLFGAIMTPGSNATLLGNGASSMRARTQAAFIDLVNGSTDKPRAELAADLGKLLNVLHFAVILFWLHDKSSGQQSTVALLKFIQGLAPMLRMSLSLPPVAGQLARFVSIIEGVFG